MTTTALAEQTEGIQLFIDQDESGQVDSVVPVRWCISRSLAEYLQADDIQHPYLLLVITNGSYEMARYVVPLTREMIYIRFSRPGINVVHATVIWKPNNTRSSELPDRVLLKKDDPVGVIDIYRERYDELIANREAIDELIRETEDEEVLETLHAQREQFAAMIVSERDKPYDGARLATRINCVTRSSQETTLRVEVPAAMFAQEPPRIMKWLGTRYPIWSKRAVDQCHLRRRALFTAATLPIVAPIALLIALIATVINVSVAGALLVSGRRGIDFRPLRHPLTHRPQQAWNDLGPSVWIVKKHTRYAYTDDDGTKHYTTDLRPQPTLLRCVNPLTISLALIVGLCCYELITSNPVILVVPVGILVTLTLITVVGGQIIGRFFPDSWWEDRKDRREERQRQKREEALAELRVRRAAELKQLSCNTQPRPAVVAALPPERRTIRLRFNQLKAQVCKPYAK